jgi:type IV fimbrial biogenesis protein FimT
VLVMRPLHPQRRRARGFTVIELMVVISLVAIISAVAVPGLRSFASGQRAKAITYDLTSDLLFARSEALKRNATVTLTPRSGNWYNGWGVASGGVEILSREASIDAVQFSGAPASISFNVSGRVSAPADAVRITVTPATGSSGNTVRCVELDLSGRARAKSGACVA